MNEQSSTKTEQDKVVFRFDSAASMGKWSLRATVWLNERGRACGVSKKIARQSGVNPDSDQKGGGFIPLGTFKGVAEALARNASASDKTNENAQLWGFSVTKMKGEDKVTSFYMTTKLDFPEYGNKEHRITVEEDIDDEVIQELLAYIPLLTLALQRVPGYTVLPVQQRPLSDDDD